MRGFGLQRQRPVADQLRIAAVLLRKIGRWMPQYALIIRGGKTMIAIFKREIKNYLKRPLFWVGIVLVIYGVFSATSPYLTTHYLTTGEEIINDQSNTSVEGEVYEGYIPADTEKHRELWHEKVKLKLTGST